jgi:excisionase family DNA binding protein
MLYTVAEAAKATGLEKSTILSAIEDGQISGTQDHSGEWQVEDEELHRLYLMVAQHYCKQKYRDHRTTSEADIEPNDTESDAGVRQEPIDSLRESADGADQVKTWDNEIRIDDRDKISISASRLGAHQTRITRLAFLALGCIAALSFYYFLGQSLVSGQKVNSPAPHSEREAISKSPLEQRSAVDTVGNTAVIGNGIEHPQQETQTTQAPNPTRSVTKPEVPSPKIAPKKPEARSQAKLVPFPETRPTTIKGWTVQNVLDGTAVLEGPSGIWKVARGDVVPGLGRVDSIVLWGGRWIVATSKGLITTR